MMLKLCWPMAVLFVLGMGPVSAQTQPPVPLPKAQELARSERRAAKPMARGDISSEKKKTKRFSYSYLLPFGVGQFEQDRTILGTALATTQAGFLLLYFDRMNSVRASNADAADVMRGVNMDAARSDAAIVGFLDQNEAYTLKAQQQANMALISFFALYTAGVVDAVFDPLGRMGLSTKKKKVEREASTGDASSRLVQDLRDEQKKESKVGVFYQPAPGSGSASAIGVSVQKPL